MIINTENALNLIKNLRSIQRQLNTLAEAYEKEVFNYAIYPVLEKYRDYLSNKETRTFIPNLMHKICRGKSNGYLFDARQFGYLTFTYHDCDYLHREQALGDGTYWVTDDIEDTLSTDIPYYFDKHGMYINYQIADLDIVREEFEKYYFADLNKHLTSVKQFDLFENLQNKVSI